MSPTLITPEEGKAHLWDDGSRSAMACDDFP